MIDITVDNNRVRVEGKEYHSFNDRWTLTALIKDIVYRAKYSGETVSIWTITYDTEKKDWVKSFQTEYH